jgi:hypothetical protein
MRNGQTDDEKWKHFITFVGQAFKQRFDQPRLTSKT